MHHNKQEKGHDWQMNGKSKNIILEIIENRNMIKNLAKNDFKTKFAGAYLGIIWAFVQPVVTVFIYWFVFDKAMGARASIRGGCRCLMCCGWYLALCHGFSFLTASVQGWCPLWNIITW